MRCSLKVFGGMLARRLVTTADVPAAQAQPEVDPAAAGLQALLATLRRVRRRRPDLGNVRAAVGHSDLVNEGSNVPTMRPPKAITAMQECCRERLLTYQP